MNNGSPAQSPVTAQAPQVAPLPNSPSFSSTMSMESSGTYDPDAPKYFFQEKYAPLNVRGNFLTLCACPKNVELGEWLAHQSMWSHCRLRLLRMLIVHVVVEQYRLLHGMLQIIQEVNGVTGLPICNENTCPTMSAGR